MQRRESDDLTTAIHSLPPPPTLGLPEKFSSWREHQADAVLDGACASKRFTLMVCATGTGKSTPAGTPTMRADGTITTVEKIQTGDILLGPGGSHRRVLNTRVGHGDLVEVRPVKGDPWVCNLDHILTLVRVAQRANPKSPNERRAGEIVDITVRDYLQKSKTWRHIHKLWRASVEFPASDLAVDPYLVGLLLGDGCLSSGSVAISNPDTEIINACKGYASAWGVKLVEYVKASECSQWHFSFGLGNPLLHACRSLGIMGTTAGTKTIPHEYKTGSRSQRLDLLAGIIDTDGHLTCGCFDFVSKSETLARDVAFISRSLGFAAYVSPAEKFCQTGAGGMYWRVYISGDLHLIPTKVKRKQAPPRRQKKDVTRTGFDIVPCGEDKFYGIKLDGDGRYLLGDFTVTHNSLTYLSQALLSGRRCAILTSTKALQQQLVDDFAAVGLADIRGGNAYQCLAVKPGGPLAHLRDLTRNWQGCDDAPCRSFVKCDLFADGCLHYDAVRRAARAPIVVTNYSYWMTKHLHTDPKGPLGLGTFDMLVMDEAHAADAELASFLTTTISPFDQGFLEQPPPPEDQKTEVYREWGSRERQYLAPRLSSLKAKIESAVATSDDPEAAVIKEYRHLAAVDDKLKTLTTFKKDWIYAKDGREVRFGPSNPAPWAESALFLNIPHIIMTSATISRKTADSLGIPSDQLEVHEYPAAFPVERRPVYIIPAARMQHRISEAELDIWRSRIDHIIGQRLDRKGIIHTTSYSRAAWLTQRSKHRHHMISHDQRGTRQAVDQFKRAKAPAILVSPSVTTGHDFPGDTCRYIIVSKVPFPSVKDRFVKARQKLDKEYPLYCAMQSLVQSVGRGMRSADDMVESFIVDSQAVWFLYKYKHLMPRWFAESISKPATIPSPPPLRG